MAWKGGLSGVAPGTRNPKKDYHQMSGWQSGLEHQDEKGWYNLIVIVFMTKLLFFVPDEWLIFFHLSHEIFMRTPCWQKPSQDPPDCNKFSNKKHREKDNWPQSENN